MTTRRSAAQFSCVLALTATSCCALGPEPGASKPEETGQTAQAVSTPAPTATAGRAAPAVSPQASPDVSIQTSPAGAAIVTNGKFTNVYVFPDPAKESWDAHLKTLTKDIPWPAGAVPASYTQEGIDGFTADLMSGWPGYFDSLMQYRTIWQVGISPPQFLGSKVASQACVDAALKDAVKGVVQWNTLRSLANCHVDGDDPSPQVNLIISPDILVGPPNFGPDSSPDLCTTGANAYHAWGVNTPNFAVVPLNSRCSSGFNVFTQAFSHEDVEILSDPAGGGYRADWYTIPGSLSKGQLADICQTGSAGSAPGVGNPSGSSFVAFSTPPVGGYKGHAVARYWSNFDKACLPQFEGPTGTTTATWVLGSGSPLARLTGQDLDLPLGLPEVRVTNDLPLVELRLFVQTGGDDLRGDSGNLADATVHFTTGDVTTRDISASRGWDNDETHSVVLRLPPNAHVGDITGITIHKRYDDGGAACAWACGDNWNVDQVALMVSFQATPPVALMVDQTGQASLASLNLPGGWAGPNAFGNPSLIPGAPVTPVFQQSPDIWAALTVGRKGQMDVLWLDQSSPAAANKAWQGPAGFGVGVLVPGAPVSPVFEQSPNVFAALTVGQNGQMNVVWLDESSPAGANKGWQGPAAFGAADLAPGALVSPVFEQSPKIFAALTVGQNGQMNVVWLDESSPAEAKKGWQGPAAFGAADLVPGAPVSPVFEQSPHVFAALTVGTKGQMNVVWLDESSPAEAKKGWQGPAGFGAADLLPGAALSPVFEQSPHVFAALTVGTKGQMNVVWLDESSPAEAKKGWQGPAGFGAADLVPGAPVSPVFEQSPKIFAALTVGTEGQMNVVWLDESSPAEAKKGWQGPAGFGDADLVPGARMSPVFEQSLGVFAALTVAQDAQLNVVWLDESSPAEATKGWQGPAGFGPANLVPGAPITVAFPY